MKSLNQIRQFLVDEKHQSNIIYNYVIPECFNTHQVDVDTIIVGDGNIMVNPYDFLIATIDYIVDQTPLKHMNFAQPYHVIVDGDEKLTDGDWIKKSVVYSMMIRTSTTYDHDRSGTLDLSNIYDQHETGSFVKSLMLLPHLLRLGVDVLYLLPITRYSKRDKKGELGSPYGVTNFFEIEESLKDSLTGDSSSADLEFKALVEACHILGIKVVIDIIPRTNSRHSDYILEHPEWFYWIKKDAKESYHPPLVKTLGPTLVPKVEYFGELFNSPDVIDHLKQFVINPKESDPIAWENFIKTIQPNDNLLEKIEDTFGMSVAYAFSDHINDPQPTWSDVTYFRMYMDHPNNSKPFLDELDFDVAPYILYDVAKTSLNPGSSINEPLWDLISNIIPHFQTEFGIDGARIDMGHALPKDLVAMIINNAKAIDSDFCFIAEELDTKNAKLQKDQGYNMIIGDGFMNLSKVTEGRFNAFAYGMRDIETPVFACGETHDSPRLASRPGGKLTSKLVTLFSYFIPNTIPFINSGQEFYEEAPINTGLDVNPDHPYVGPLALFDKFSFNMTRIDRDELVSLCEKVVAIRNNYLDAFLDPSRMISLSFEHMYVHSAAFGFENERALLIAIANTNLYHDETHRVFLMGIPERFKSNVTIKEIFASEEMLDVNYQLDEYQSLWVRMKAGEVKLIEMTLN